MASFPLSLSSLFTDPSLVSYWPLVSNSTDNKDSNNGTDTSISYGSGNSPFSGVNGAGFNGSSSKIVLPSGGSGGNLKLVSSYTIMGWFKLAQVRQVLFQCWNNDPSNNEAGIQMLVDVNDTIAKFRLDTGRNTSGVYKNVRGSTSVGDSTFRLMTAVYDDAADELRLYLNGSLEATTTGVTLPPVYVTSPYTRIGSNFETASGVEGLWVNGAISDVAVFSRALTLAEIVARYNGTDLPVSGGGMPLFL